MQISNTISRHRVLLKALPEQSWALLSSLLLMTVLCSGCLPILPRHYVHIDGPFDGLSAKITETSQAGGTLRLLVVHGMGSETEGYSAPMIQAVTSRLSLKPHGQSNRVEITQDCRVYGALNIQAYMDGPRKMLVYEVTWAPTTKPIKTNQFQQDIQRPPHRQLANQQLKQLLINSNLSDALLYAGKFRPQMQYPIKATFNRMLTDGFAPGDQVAIVTFSLGSSMVIDTLATMASAERSTNSMAPGESIMPFLTHTTLFFMFASQLPLMELSDLQEPPPKNASASASRAPPGLQEFLRLKSVSKPALNNLQLVAFSDPNDLLSYRLNKTNFPPGSQGINVSGVNVTMTIEHWSLFGVFANPKQAHMGWDKDKRALDLITFGYRAIAHGGGVTGASQKSVGTPWPEVSSRGSLPNENL